MRVDCILKYFSCFSQKSGIDISCSNGDNLREMSNHVIWEKKKKKKHIRKMSSIIVCSILTYKAPVITAECQLFVIFISIVYKIMDSANFSPYPADRIYIHFQGVGLFESTSGLPEPRPILLVLGCLVGDGMYHNLLLSIFKASQ